MSISSLAVPLSGVVNSQPPRVYFRQTESVFYNSYCDFDGLRALPIIDALIELKVIAEKNPTFFMKHYEKFPVLSPDQAFPLFELVAEKDTSEFMYNYKRIYLLCGDQALPLLKILAEKAPNIFVSFSYVFTDLSADQALPLLRIFAEKASGQFVEYYKQFPALTADQALPLLTIVAEKAPREFAENYEKFPALSAEQAFSLLKIVAEKAPREFAGNYEKFPALSAEQAVALLPVVAEKAPREFAGNYEKFPVLSAEQAFPLLTIVAEKAPREFVKNYEKFPDLSVDQALPLLTIVAEKSIRRELAENYVKLPDLPADQNPFIDGEPEEFPGDCEGFPGLSAGLPLDLIEDELEEFPGNYEGFSGLSDDGALTKKELIGFAENYEKFPILSVDQAFPLLKIVAVEEPRGFAGNYEKFPALSAEQAFSLLKIVAEKAPREFAGNYEKFPALSAEQAVALLPVVAEKAPREFAGNYEKFPVLSAEQAFPLLKIVAEKEPIRFAENYEKFPDLSAEQQEPVLAMLVQHIFPPSMEKHSRASFYQLKKQLKESSPLIKALSKELTRRFLEGELKTRDDIPLIEHIIQHSPDLVHRSIEDIMRNVSKETADNILIALIKYHKELFSTNLGYIFAQLMTQREGEASARIDVMQFLEVPEFEEIKDHFQRTLPSIWATFLEFKQSEEAEFRKKDSELWECTGRKKQPEGYLYTFKCRPEFIGDSEYRVKTDEIYPAIEPHCKNVSAFLGFPHYTKFLAELGYLLVEDKKQVTTESSDLFPDRPTQDGTTITIPDREALMYRYNQLRATRYKKLPELSIVSSSGIASDNDFVKALIENDGLISNGKEFIHDQLVHITPLLIMARNGSEFFKEIKKAKIDWFQAYVSKLALIKEGGANLIPQELSAELQKNLPILETLLGVVVDLMASKVRKAGDNIDENIFDFNDIISASIWVAYLKKRYPEEIILSTGTLIPKYDDAIIKKLAEFIDDLELPATS